MSLIKIITRVQPVNDEGGTRGNKTRCIDNHNLSTYLTGFLVKIRSDQVNYFNKFLKYAY